jgi:nitrite reductase (NO-forming)
VNKVVALAIVVLAVPLIVHAYGRNQSPGTIATASSGESLDPIVGREDAAMTAAPFVPPPITRDHATRVVLNIEVKEHSKTLTDDVTYTYWTFGDTAPANFIRIRQGDLVETHFSNHPDNAIAHNIDFHALAGPGGGGEASFVAPGHSMTFEWRATRPGLYLYHCVAAPAGLHIANGMYGLILVEPKGGLPKVDKEFFIVQGEFYTSGSYGAPGPQVFSMEKALKEQPEYVVFNGRVGSLMGDNALKANVGERIRLYVGNAGPSLVSSFHIVGGIFDNVYSEGGTTVNQHNVQTTLVPAGGSSMVEFTPHVAGDYQLVDHSMFRAFNKGAMGSLIVTGPSVSALYSGKLSEGVYNPGTHLERLSANSTVRTQSPVQAGIVQTTNNNSLLEQGEHVYSTICATCHQVGGQGLPNIFPPLARSDFLMKDKDRAVGILLQGLQEEITVNGNKYKGVMPRLPLTNQQIAGVLTYVRTNFGNRGDAVAVTDVERLRNALQTKSDDVVASAR